MDTFVRSAQAAGRLAEQLSLHRPARRRRKPSLRKTPYQNTIASRQQSALSRQPGDERPSRAMSWMLLAMVAGQQDRERNWRTHFHFCLRGHAV